MNDNFLEGTYLDTDPDGTTNLKRHDMVCDFCLGRPIRWSYPVDPNIRIPLLNPVATHSTDDWAACMACHECIQTGDWKTLARRSVDNSAAMEGLKPTGKERRVAIRSVTKLHQQFQKARTGPPYREPWDLSALNDG